MSIDHLARAKDYMAKGEEYYRKAADEIQKWLDADAARTHQQAGELLGKHATFVGRLLRARNNGDGDITQAIDWGSGSNRRDEVVEKVMADPEKRRQTIAAMPSAQIDEVIQEAHAVRMDRLHAKQDEHRVGPKPLVVGDLMDPADPFDPSESWIDTHLLRVREKTHILRIHFEKWGLVSGSMDNEKLLAYLDEAERDIAVVRAAAQERVADHSQVEA